MLDFNKDDVGFISLTYESFFEKDEESLASFPWVPKLRGRWQLEDRINQWLDTSTVRICMEIGTQRNYQNYLESLMWYRSVVDGQWRVQSLKSHEYDVTKAFGDFCRGPIDSDEFTKDDSEIIISDQGSFDRENRKLNFEWVRPFDINVNHGLTLVGGFDYNIWYTFVVVDEAD